MPALPASNDTAAEIDIAIQIRDPDASLRFYRDFLGFVPCGAMSVRDRQIYGLRFGHSTVRLVHERTDLERSNPRVGAQDRAYGYFMMALAVTNVAELVAECEQLGFEVETPCSPIPSSIDPTPGASYAYIRDPDGNLVELICGCPWPTSP